MLGKSQNALIIICTNIITLLIIYLGIIAINFFTERKIVNKQMIVGINPVTKTSMFYQEPLTIAIEKEEMQEDGKQEATEIKQNIGNSNIEKVQNEQPIEEQKQEVTITSQTLVEPAEVEKVEVKEMVSTRI